ncbi:MAG: enoyl-CoA hydratase/isomerase family protein [Rhizobiales bacterium]|nr:enoyl-CoA hydratase/isomerase family protein [Hyphomicrobiales bacterium]
MLTFDEYSEKYPCIKMERQGGILQMTTHTRGDTIQWAYDDTNLYPGIYYHLGEAFHDISSDVENKVVIWTGAGDAFSGPRPSGANAPPRTARGWERPNWKGRHMQGSLLDIDVPIICAVNGPALKHADLIFLCDIVLAADHATFMDGHMLCNTVPGDGAHVVYPLLMGLTRARYFLLTSEVISAEQAKTDGLVNEVLPREKLMDRAWELAEQLAEKPPLVLRHARTLLAQELRRRMLDMQGYGLALEGLANMDDQPEPILQRDFPGVTQVKLRTELKE